MNLGSSLQVYAACELEQQQVSQCHSELEAYQTKTVRAIKRIFSEQQPCITHHENKLQEKPKAKLDRMERTLKTILAGKLVIFQFKLAKMVSDLFPIVQQYGIQEISLAMPTYLISLSLQQ